MSFGFCKLFFSRSLSGSGDHVCLFLCLGGELGLQCLGSCPVPQDLIKVLLDLGVVNVVDCGILVGDDRGAVALGRYAEDITSENDYEMLFVANCYRPLTKTAEDALEVMREIEVASKLKFTGIVNNSNIGNLTTACDVKASLEFINKLSEISGLPVVMTTATAEVFEGIKDDVENAFCIGLQDKYFEIN